MDDENENDVLCEKIINDVNAVFVKDPDLSSFEIIPTILNRNKSPVIHVDHHLGVESWCAKHIYDYAHRTVVAQKLRNKHLLANNGAVVKYVNVALLINPDVTSFWHMRRQLVEKDRLGVQKEFQFSVLVLSKKPKSSEAFAYRRWLFSFQSSESIDWLQEISLCDRCADKSSSNYHAWTHRQWVLQKAPHLLLSEIHATEKFIKKHIGDYSCYHYRQFVIQKMFEMSFSDVDTCGQYADLQNLINYYLISGVQTNDDVLAALLPGVSWNAINEDRLKSFLFCCNLAAHDMRFCDDLKNFYGARESFENHRRASLKFIVDNCIRLKNSTNDCHPQPLPKVSRSVYADNLFLLALKKSEGMLGERHRKWCSIFLGFEYATNNSM